MSEKGPSQMGLSFRDKGVLFILVEYNTLDKGISKVLQLDFLVVRTFG